MCAHLFFNNILRENTFDDILIFSIIYMYLISFEKFERYNFFSTVECIYRCLVFFLEGTKISINMQVF
jgi:hypothetical protein